MSKHAPGKLVVSEQSFLRDERGAVVAYVPGLRSLEETRANAQHIVDCWNACAGINPKAVPMMREALKNLLALIVGWMDDKSEPTREEADKFFDVCNAAVDALELAKEEKQ